MISDDTTTLFEKGLPGVRFRQGTITAWDPETGANEIDLAGGTLTNVKVLQTGEAIALKAGHVVGLIGQGNTWGILGRFAGFGDPDFAGSSVSFATGFATASNFSVTNTALSKVSGSIVVPSWADQAAVQVTATTTLYHNVAGINDYATLYARIGTSFGEPSQQGFAASTDPMSTQSFNATHSLIVDSPGASISISAWIGCQGATWPAHVTNNANVSALAIFRSTV